MVGGGAGKNIKNHISESKEAALKAYGNKLDHIVDMKSLLGDNWSFLPLFTLFVGWVP